jgi:hypothetical protein
MVIEKIEDEALRKRITEMIEGGRNVTSEFIQNRREYLDMLPYKDTTARFGFPRTLRRSGRRERGKTGRHDSAYPGAGTFYPEFKSPGNYELLRMP